MSRAKVDPSKDVAAVILDTRSGRQYHRGRFLGKGGFARCYELAESKTKALYAGKIVCKSMLVKAHQKEKMTQEITIHRELHHKHIVDFVSYFEDSSNVYIILELCKRRSLMELHRRRKALTEPEARYFIQQILLGVKFLHDHNIIHRDLKLGNLFLNDEMEVKIGDFGLATRVDFSGERKKTMCGTPNYIAPEILAKTGHSFEVDVWSIGCILYTLLVGKPPFETESLKETYSRIKKNEYIIPNTIGTLARNVINRMLQSDPTKRPTVAQILADDFMTHGYIPTRLPTSCLSMAPRFDTKVNVSLVARHPLQEINTEGAVAGKAGEACADADPSVAAGSLARNPTAPASAGGTEGATAVSGGTVFTGSRDCHLADLKRQLVKLVQSRPADRPNINMDEAEDPAAVPFFWFSKWVDYSDKYGLGYQLCDDSIGIIFNDTTKLCLLANGEDLHYIQQNNVEHYYTLKEFPRDINKKVVLLRYFRNYMNDHLVKAGATIKPREGDELSRVPNVHAWFRTRSAIVLHLNNGTLQINFFEDHCKIILCPLMGAVTYINEEKEARTYRFSLLQEHGCCRPLSDRLSYASQMVDRLLTARSVSGSGKSSAPTTITSAAAAASAK